MRAAAYFIASLCALILLGLINVYVARRLRRVIEPRFEGLVRAVLVGTLASVVVARIVGRIWEEAPVRYVLLPASTTQLGVVLFALLLLVIQGAERLAGRRFAQPSPLTPATGTSDSDAPGATPVVRPAPAADALQAPQESLLAPSEQTGRRRFLLQASTASALLVATSSSFYGALRGRNDYQLEEVVIRIPGLAPSLNGFRIVQVSDVHIGTFVGDAELNIALDYVRRARADLIVLTGDLLDQDIRLAPRLGHFARRLQGLARYGAYAVSGNHDFYAGVDAVERVLAKAGVVMLRNASTTIGQHAASVALLGVDDVWGERLGGGPDLDRALQTFVPTVRGAAPSGAELPRILLCHNPSYFKRAAGRVALQLSGHTHGGQISAPGAPTRVLFPGGWIAGAYAQAGSQLYVNRGFGTVGPPVRLAAAPEITQLILTT